MDIKIPLFTAVHEVKHTNENTSELEKFHLFYEQAAPVVAKRSRISQRTVKRKA